MESTIAFFTANWSEITVGILALLRVVEVIVKLTPSVLDDKIFLVVDGIAAKILGRR